MYSTRAQHLQGSRAAIILISSSSSSSSIRRSPFAAIRRDCPPVFRAAHYQCCYYSPSNSARSLGLILLSFQIESGIGFPTTRYCVLCTVLLLIFRFEPCSVTWSNSSHARSILSTPQSFMALPLRTTIEHLFHLFANSPTQLYHRIHVDCIEALWGRGQRRKV